MIVHRHFPAVELGALASVLGRTRQTLRMSLGHVGFTLDRTDDAIFVVPVSDAAGCLGLDESDLLSRLGHRTITN